MIVTIPSGSQMDRIVRCPASAALPQIHDANPDDGRERGTAMHRFLERVPEIGREAALAETDEEHRTFCASIELATLADRMTLSRELALAYNWRSDSARRLLPLEHRAYEVDPSCEIPLTLDLAGAADAAVYAGDYKSGHGWLPEPAQSMQLGLGALALARLHDATDAHVEYIRIRDDGEPRRWRASLDIFGLEAAAERVRETMAGVERLRAELAVGATPNVVEGQWCRYCPARQHCPAKTALIRRVLSDPQPIPYLQPLTPESALRVYQLLSPARSALAQAEAALYAYAKVTPIPLGEDEDGSVRLFGELRRPGNEVLDGAIAHRVLTEMFDGEAANGAVTMDVTKKAITDVVRTHLQPGTKITAEAERVLARIRELGGARRPETTTTTEYTVSPDGDTKARRRKAG